MPLCSWRQLGLGLDARHVEATALALLLLGPHFTDADVLARVVDEVDDCLWGDHQRIHLDAEVDGPVMEHRAVPHTRDCLLTATDVNCADVPLQPLKLDQA